jgi:hypothetical protein
MENSTSFANAWEVSGVAFPEGTEFRGNYKGYYYSARVVNKTLMLYNRAFLTPSAAAISITRHPVDGWLFWECKFPDQSCWQSLAQFKNTSQ